MEKKRRCSAVLVGIILSSKSGIADFWESETCFSAVARTVLALDRSYDEAW